MSNDVSFTSFDQTLTPNHNNHNDPNHKQKTKRPFLRNVSNVAAFVQEVISRKQLDRVPSSDLGPAAVTYTKDAKNGREYYEDTYNDLPYQCTFGTREEDGIWMNRYDSAGLVMSGMVWIFIGRFEFFAAEKRSFSFMSLTFHFTLLHSTR